MSALHAKDVPISSKTEGPALEKLQANILKGHGRDHVILLFCHFQALPQDARTWLRGEGQTVTTAAEQERAAAGFRGNSVDGGTVKTVSLSWEGYRHLGLDDPAAFFEMGMPVPRSPLREGMLDRLDDIGDRSSDSWEPEYLQNSPESAIHALVLLADSNWTRLIGRESEFRVRAEGIALVVKREEGHQLKRAGDRIEHFGYREGISQPLFFEDDLSGEFLPGTSVWDPSAGPGLVLIKDPFSDDPEASGSFLAFRKLQQHVSLFHEMESRIAADLGANSEAQRKQVEAMIVGRDREGNPLAGTSGGRLNDFNFDEDLIPPVRCPLHAHIRKANPRRNSMVRDDFRQRRIARRSITYGVDPESLTSIEDEDVERGVLFMCYQRALSGQFEFIQHFWLNASNFPMKDSGPDVFSEGFNQAQWWGLPGARPRDGVTGNGTEVVSVRGGCYLFTPSIVFLRTL